MNIHRPRWMRADTKPRLRDPIKIEGLDADLPRTKPGKYRLREEKEDPKLKDAEKRNSREHTPKFRKEPVKIDEKSIVRTRRTKPNLRVEKPKEEKEEFRGNRKPVLNPQQHAIRAEIERRLDGLRHPRRNKA